ncbi:PspA-associated protein PspAA [Aestuariimicrobium soli]|uniref:PspA-associated protein PspAA n=1 Tax=Aestuariimicrobium soli TaxID=2035834 RepID=UPI003EBCD400
MIIRIMGEGQYSVPDEAHEALNVQDDLIEKAVENSDQEALTSAVEALLAIVRLEGTEVPDDVLADSELIVPDASVRLEEMRSWLSEAGEYEGLIPNPS